MGLFDKKDPKKRKDDFDSPVERVDLGAMPAAASAPVARPAEAPTPSAVAAELPVTTPAAEPVRAAAPAHAAASVEADDYGIEKAIELMRTLPSENVELVVKVVKFSLESVGIKLPTIIEDAARRQKDIQGRIAVRKAEIADLEQEIKVRKEEIDALEFDYLETTTVRERLELAESLGQRKEAEPAQAATAGGRATRPTNLPPTLAPLTTSKK
jgi:hypothetical protein